MIHVSQRVATTLIFPHNHPYPWKLLIYKFRSLLNVTKEKKKKIINISIIYRMTIINKLDSSQI